MKSRKRRQEELEEDQEEELEENESEEKVYSPIERLAVGLNIK